MSKIPNMILPYEIFSFIPFVFVDVIVMLLLYVVDVICYCYNI